MSLLKERKNNLQSLLEILYLLQLVCLHLKGSVRLAEHSSLYKNLSLWSSQGLTCPLSKSRSASMNYSLQMNSRNACLLWRGPLTSVSPSSHPKTPWHHPYAICIFSNPPSSSELGGVILRKRLECHLIILSVFICSFHPHITVTNFTLR